MVLTSRKLKKNIVGDKYFNIETDSDYFVRRWSLSS